MNTLDTEVELPLLHAGEAFNNDARKRIIATGYERAFARYVEADTAFPLFMQGDALDVLKTLPSDRIDCCITSPPYWGKREYENGGIGLEIGYPQFIASLLAIFAEVKRVLKPTGSFWLNIGDTYQDKGLLGIPWRIALALCDQHGWVLRNSVIWNKVKGGMDNSTDRLGNAHEHVFHFVKSARGYYYDADAIRSSPGQSKVNNGVVVSATGVSGIRYRRQVELSTSLAPAEKMAALAGLEKILASVANGELSDFRMIIRGQQRTTHSDSTSVSGRAKELNEKGFYFLKYHPNGSKPTDVWDIVPEDTQRRALHFAPFPADLCRIPILATCPQNGIVLDPFCGVGTAMLVAKSLDRKSVGIDISEKYLDQASDRCASLI